MPTPVTSSPLTLRPCTVDEVLSAPNIGDIVQSYAGESAIGFIAGEAAPQTEIYRALEFSGMLHGVSAWDGPFLAGFIGLLVAPSSHYANGGLMATAECFFVAPAWRAGGTGLKLLGMAEDIARTQGARAMFVSAPAGSRLAAALPRLGFCETNRVFTRPLEGGN